MFAFCRVIALVAAVPLIVVPPLSAVYWRQSWEARYEDTYYIFYAVEIVFILFVVSANLVKGFQGTKAAKAERDTRRQLMAQAFKAQRLLEIAVPPPIARALVSGIPAHTLTRSYSSVSIAFIFLTDFDRQVATLGSHALLAWLDDVYATFDRLIDLYEEAINKARQMCERCGYSFILRYGLALCADRNRRRVLFGVVWSARRSGGALAPTG
jgi:hypothetical protein